MQHYSDLNALLRSEPEARHYFDTLPDYAREQISTGPTVSIPLPA